jgi:hypothetical protein
MFMIGRQPKTPWAETLSGACPTRRRAAQWSQSAKHPMPACCYKTTTEVTRPIAFKDNPQSPVSRGDHRIKALDIQAIHQAAGVARKVDGEGNLKSYGRPHRHGSHSRVRRTDGEPSSIFERASCSRSGMRQTESTSPVDGFCYFLQRRRRDEKHCADRSKQRPD